MNPESAAGWAEYLTNPYALAGFIVFAIVGIAAVFKIIPSSKLKSAETHSLLRLLIVGGLLLGGLAIALAFSQNLLKPRTQEVRNINGADVAVGGSQATVITSKQSTTMKNNQEKCGQVNQVVDGVTDSRIAVAGCEASTTTKE